MSVELVLLEWRYEGNTFTRIMRRDEVAQRVAELLEGNVVYVSVTGESRQQ